MAQAQDKIGQTISVGDILAYGVRCGNSGDLKLYRVLEVLPVARKDPDHEDETHQVVAREVCEPWGMKQWRMSRRKVRLRMLRGQSLRTHLRAEAAGDAPVTQLICWVTG
jgi:hypothetical protein